MKKQMLTKQDIQRELLAKLNKRKAVAIYLTIITFVSIVFYVIYIIACADGIDLKDDRISFSVPSVVIIMVPFVIVFFVIFLVRYYYLDLYRIKTVKFEITEERLYQKAIEYVSYYNKSEKENSLYFRHGRISVDKAVYSYSNIGDPFYLIVLSSKRAPTLVYHMKYYEIEKTQA